MSNSSEDHRTDTAALPALDERQHRRFRFERAKSFALALSLSLAVCLTIPASEIRAKTFRINLMLKSLYRPAS